MSKKDLYVAKEWKDRKIQQALLQPHKPEHKEILRDYRSKQRRDAYALETQTHGARVGNSVSTSKPKRSIVDVPKSKLGPKLLLDTR